MQVFRAASFFIAAAFCCSAAVFAQIESTPIPMTPKPDFSKMSFLMGRWNCSVKSARRPSAYQTTSTTTMSPDGYWMITRTVNQKTSWAAQTTTEDRLTYDPSTNRWVDINYDDQGGYNVSTSPGWTGNTITWTDSVITQVNATASTNPTTVTKVSDTHTTSVSSFKEPSGRTVNVTSTCTKG